MTQPIGYTGLKRATPEMDRVGKLVFALTTSVTAVKQFPRGDYSIFVSLAGASDLSFEFTNDTAENIKNGTAEWTGVTAKTAVAAGDYYYGDVRDITAMRITHIKNGGAADNASIVTALGGRAQVRAVPVEAARPDQLFLGGAYPAPTGGFAPNPYA